MTTAGNGETARSDVSALYEEFMDAMPGVFDCVDYLCWAEANHEDGVTTLYWGMARDPRPQSLVAGGNI